MRLSTDATGADRDERRGVQVIRAALDAGATVFDTGHAYGSGEGDFGHNERLLARAIEEAGADPARLRIVTKCGMRRPDGTWRPDGRARAILDDARASVEALRGHAIDVLLLHAPDPKTPLATSVRALARARDEGLARAIGVSNVSLTQLEAALAIAPIAAVEVALGAFDDESARGGLVRFCCENGIDVLAHSPLGGPKRAHRLASDGALLAIANRLGATPAAVVLAYVASIHPRIVPLAGARTVATAVSAIGASRIVLDDDALAALGARFPALGELRRPRRAPIAASNREVVILMGIPGSGKSRTAAEYVARGYERLNRDDAGGTLRDLARALDTRLAAGADRIVLDNTYTTRASRSDVVRVAHAHGARVRCIHLDTPLEDAQINVVSRMIEKHGALLEPDAIARLARTDPNLVRPTVLFRMLRELEPPSESEGFGEIVVTPFARSYSDATRAGAAIALDRIADLDADPIAMRADAIGVVARTPEDAPCLLVGWRPGADVAWIDRIRAIADEVAECTHRIVEVGLCTHAAGPPVCWCRPPLPGLWVAFAERHRIDPRASVFLGESTAHRTMARALGLAFPGDAPAATLEV